jgi:AcrR family transcriptional regulator
MTQRTRVKTRKKRSPKRRHVELNRQTLYRRIWSRPLKRVAAELGLSGSGLTKICNRLLIPCPTRNHWRKPKDQRAIRPPLPVSPEKQAARITISAAPSPSRRVRTRLDPVERRAQLMLVTERLIVDEGVHAITMKRVAQAAGLSETAVYKFYRTPEQILIEMTDRAMMKVDAARIAAGAQGKDLLDSIRLSTLSYLSEVVNHGSLPQILMSRPNMPAVVEERRRERMRGDLYAHAQWLVDTYGMSRTVAIGGTAIISRMIARVGKIIADGKLSLAEAQALSAIAIVECSRCMIDEFRAGARQGAEAF